MKNKTLLNLTKPQLSSIIFISQLKRLSAINHYPIHKTVVKNLLNKRIIELSKKQT